MIPKNIKKEHIIRAIEEIKRDGIPKNRISKKFFLELNGKQYPPKYVVSLANKFVNGTEVDPADFSGGRETNDFLNDLGFTIVPASTPMKSIKPYKKQREARLSSNYHNERCPNCKETVKRLLEKIYGLVSCPKSITYKSGNLSQATCN